MKKTFFLLLSACTIYSCSSPIKDPDPTGKSTDTTLTNTFDVSKVRESIESANKRFSEALLKGDSSAIVGFYHSDAMVFPPNMPQGTSKTMGSMAASISKMGIKTFTLNTKDVTGTADEIVETGTFEMGDGSKAIDKGKYIVVWKPENGEWKLWRDIWNSDNPPATAAK